MIWFAAKVKKGGPRNYSTARRAASCGAESDSEGAVMPTSARPRQYQGTSLPPINHTDPCWILVLNGASTGKPLFGQNSRRRLLRFRDPLCHWRIVLLIMIDNLTNEEWVALLCIARGVSVRRISKPVRLRLKAMLLITRGRAGLALTENGKKFLLLGT